MKTISPRALRPLLAAVLAVGCASGSPLDGPPTVDASLAPPDSLSEYGLFDWAAETGFAYNDRVVPYELNTPLFSDFAIKERAIYVPEGETAAIDGEDVFQFPVNTAIVKTFYFPADFRSPDEDVRLIETRVLVNGPSGWQAWPYLWNEEQTEAELAVAGDAREVSFIDAEGVERTANYLVPQRNQCNSCHERRLELGDDRPAMTPIGPRPRNMDRDRDFGDAGVVNQLTHLANLGMLADAPAPADVAEAFDFRPVEAGGLSAIPEGELDRAARDYLDINCAHCHDPRGVNGVTSQLFLNFDNDDEFRLGYCKRPGSAGAGTGGLTWDIVPGDAEQSILWFRMDTEEIGAMMPLIGRSLAHDRGVEVVRAWIDSLEPIDCSLREE